MQPIAVQKNLIWSPKSIAIFIVTVRSQSISKLSPPVIIHLASEEVSTLEPGSSSPFCIPPSRFFGSLRNSLGEKNLAYSCRPLWTDPGGREKGEQAEICSSVQGEDETERRRDISSLLEFRRHLRRCVRSASTGKSQDDRGCRRTVCAATTQGLRRAQALRTTFSSKPYSKPVRQVQLFSPFFG